MTADTRPGVAIFPWGDPIEEFLAPIGLVLDDFAEKMTGGWLFGYVAGLQQAGWRPIIVCVSGAVSEPTRLVHAGTGAPIWAVPPVRPGEAAAPAPNRESLRRWKGTPWRAWARILQEERCRAILVQEYEYARFDALVALGLRLGVPTYATFQGGDLTASPVEGVVRPWTLRLAAGLIVPSARERERLKARYGLNGDKVVAVPNPLDLDEWRAGDRSVARAELGLPHDAFVVVNHGRIDVHRKGLDILMEAWRRLVASRPDMDARLVLIGSGQGDADLADLIAGYAVPHLTWIREYVTDRVFVRRWLSAASAFAIASRTEGLPVAPLEAMACGLPVVASDAHGLPDIFEHGRTSGGLVVPREDPGAMAEALARLADDPHLRVDLGRAGRMRAERYGIPMVGEALARVLGRKARGAAAGGDAPSDLALRRV
ncbi:glycosyltransferase family 4 protein [Caulobacter sp. 17J80-11]|uniref:glycosyltransferase family 4 protein n=1 Tax=Caulobacter sp. 17J80-11 TaxID=2763502 RepID=UPI0016539A85|nr:glycosyltransferase family 4 protein [Caulobacter sp. 17J80-11]MBC6982438.1 glycosyltransferase family 4 protein [Caulobacter sp. 17J80-11]